MSQEHKQRYNELTKLPIDKQAGTFLRAFVLEFQGRFEEVLELGTQFGKYALEGFQDLEVMRALIRTFVL